MTEKQYNVRVNECRENSCYHCCCNNTPFCFKDELKPIIKDFPNRHFKQLTIKEQQKILELEVRK